MSQLSCELCNNYETYKKEALDLHVTMAHKYKKLDKSESKLTEKADIINGGSAETKISATPEPTPEPTRPAYVPRRRGTLYDCTKCIFRFLNEEGRDSHLEKEHKPSDPLKTDPNHPDNIKKAEEAAKNGGNTAPPTREPYRPRGRSQLFKCPKCIYKFLSQDGLDSHLEKEHDPNDPDDGNAEPPKPKGDTNTYKPRRRSVLYDCKKCIYRFLSQDGLDSHMTKDHKPDDPDLPPGARK